VRKERGATSQGCDCDKFSKEIVYMHVTFYYVHNCDCFTHEVILVVLLMFMFVYVYSRELLD